MHRPSFNACLCDSCADDGDCSDGELCVPAGAWIHFWLPETEAVSACRPTGCRVSGDCTDGTGPICMPVVVCDVDVIVSVKVCTYAESECRATEDCPEGICDAAGGTPRCIDGLERGCWE